jgi:hypothetical protein
MVDWPHRPDEFNDSKSLPEVDLRARQKERMKSVTLSFKVLRLGEIVELPKK